MDKKKLFDKVYSFKASLDEEDKKKNNYNNTFQKNKQKNNQKTFFPKNNNCKPNKNNGPIKEKLLPTNGVINSPSQNKNAISSKIKYLNKEKEKEKNKAKINYLKETPKKKKTTNDNNEENNKNKIKGNKFETIDSDRKYENDDGLITSFEKKPSELKSPETISEDSFTSSYEDDGNKNPENNKNIKEEVNNSKEVKANSHLYTKLVENELNYLERANYNNNQGKGNNTEKNSKDIKNNYKSKNNNIKDKSLIEKEQKQREKDKKKEKFKNIEIKTTTRQTTYAKSNNNNNKIIENKNPSELIMNTERESTNSNNIINQKLYKDKFCKYFRK